jgi:apolipoprotein N-acyltransferase
MRLAPFVGVYGLSFVFAMLNTAISFLVLRRPRKHLLWVAPLPLLILLPSLPPALPGARQSVVVQPNIEQHEQWTESTAEELKRKLVSMSLRSARQSDEPPPEILLWPEVPAPLYYYEDSRLREQINQLSALSGVPILFGTVAHTPQRSPLNSALMVAPNGEAVDRYDKIKLVPFGEFVPPLFGFVTRITQEAGDFVPGNRVVTFPVSGRKVGAFICYESVFPHLVRQFTRSGGELLVNLSNDGYFGKTAAREQHLKIVRMRAAENRRWIIRATNDGITAGIDPAGRLAQVLEPYQTAATRMRFSWEAGITPYAHYGDWFAWGCLLGGLGAVLATQVPRYIPEERRRALNRDESRARRRP